MRLLHPRLYPHGLGDFGEPGREYTDAELRKLLSGHLCRCTGYENILRAVKKTMYRRLGLPMPTEPEA